MIGTTTISLTLGIALTEAEKQKIAQLLRDALHEFQAPRYLAAEYVMERYDWLNEMQQQEKAEEVRQRVRLAAILKQSTFDGLEVK